MNLKEKLEQKKKEREHEYKFWKPDIGDIIQGTVEEIGKTITKHCKEGEEKDYIHLVTEDGQKVTIWVNSVIMTQIEDEAVTAGDVIAIEYLGEKESTKNKKKKYKDFLIVKADSEEGGDQ